MFIYDEFDKPKYIISPHYPTGIREVFQSLEYTEPKEYVNMSRYNNTRCIIDNKTGNIYHETYNDYHISESSNDRFYTVTVKTEDRLDIISMMFYGSPLNWWIIALTNNIIDPFDVKAGTILRIPPIISLYEEGGIYHNG
jgi:hypothetical protein